MGHQSNGRRYKVREQVGTHQLFVVEGTRNFVQVAAVPQAGVRLQKSPVPRNLSEYRDVSEYCVTQLADTKPTGLNKDSTCSIPWLIRSHVFATLRSSGIPALELDDAKDRDVIGRAPDTNVWLMELTSSRNLETVSDVCEYSG